MTKFDMACAIEWSPLGACGPRRQRGTPAWLESPLSSS